MGLLAKYNGNTSCFAAPTFLLPVNWIPGQLVYSAITRDVSFSTMLQTPRKFSEKRV